MAMDEGFAEAEKKVMGDVRTVVIDTYQSQTPVNKLIFVLVAVIIGALLLWWVGSTVVGFMYSAMGMLLIALTVVALAIYLYMRSQNVGLKSWTGGFVEILLIVMFMVVYVGLLDSITSIALMLAPLIIIGGVAWVGYKWYKAQENQDYANGILLMVAVFCIAFPIYQAFVVPYTIGTPVELTIDVGRGSTGDWNAYIEMNEFQFVTTMSTQFNPYLMTAVELSNWMWLSADTTEKAYVEISVVQETTGEVIYYEKAHVVYVGNNDMETIWGVIHLPVEVERYINMKFRINVQVYNLDGVLATYSSIYTHGV